MSLMLTFSASYNYQFSTPILVDATCSAIHNKIQYNCTAELSIGIIHSTDVTRSVNVTVTGPYGSNSSVMEVQESMYHKFHQLYIIRLKIYSL